MLVFMCYFESFQSSDILALALAALRDPGKIFLTNNLRFVTKDSTVRKSQVLVKCMKSPNHTIQVIYWTTTLVSCVILRVFRVLIFWLRH